MVENGGDDGPLPNPQTKNRRDLDGVDPSELSNDMYDEKSLKILDVLRRRGQADKRTIRLEAGLKSHDVDNRLRADGVLVDAGLVELVGYADELPDFRWTGGGNAPKVMALTPYCKKAIQTGFLVDREDTTDTVVVSESQLTEFRDEVDALRHRVAAMETESPRDGSAPVSETEGSDSAEVAVDSDDVMARLDALEQELDQMREGINETVLPKVKENVEFRKTANDELARLDERVGRVEEFREDVEAQMR
jgi:hypothetical protein